LSLINLKETLENDELNSNILNIAFENIIFDFRKVSEEEMQLGIVNEFKDQMRRTREAMLRNIDPDDPVYVKLLAELNRILKKKNLKEVAETKELQENIDLLRSIYDRVTDCNRRDELLREKYEHDEKFTRVHKRIFENTGWKSEVAINRTLLDIKHRTDRMILDRNALLSNEPYFKQDVQSLVIASLEKNAEFDAEMAKYINQLVVKEYLTEFRGVMA